jgi:radical SAM PhpK family P-methyltransferase
MKKKIDCLIIGHNEMDFAGYEQKVRKMGTDAGAFKDLNLNYIWYNRRPYTASEVFNLFYNNDNKGTKGNGDIKPLTTGETFSATISYLGTFIHRRGFSFDYVNSFQDQKDELAAKLEENEYLSIAITTTLYVSPFPITEIIEFVRRFSGAAKIIVGGPFIDSQYRAQPPASLEFLFEAVLGADIYVISSQGEIALVNILAALKNGAPLEHVENIFYVTPTGMRHTPRSPESSPLSGNMVDWSLFTPGVDEYVNVRTAISCPYRCSFCGFPQHAGKYRTAEVDAVERELKGLVDIPSVKSVNFIDDTFNIPAGRFKELLRMIIKNKFRFKWHSHFRCQFAGREILELMKESGCEGVFLGIESGNNDVLKHMNKAATVEKYLAGIQLLKEFDILTYGSFIIGFPGETEETVRDTSRFIRESGLDFYRAQAWYCDPITPVWEKREQYKLTGSSFEWQHATMNSRRAADIVDDIFTSIDAPTWVPQYNFECDALFHLLNRGLSREQVKAFLTGFNKGVKEKLAVSSPAAHKDAGPGCIEDIKNALGGSVMSSLPTSLADKFDADFDF